MHRLIDQACRAIGSGKLDAAKEIIRKEYPFESVREHSRSYSDYQELRMFLRDGFVDRYRGDRLILPPVLRIMSRLMPDEFPFHKHWKASECHLAFWHLLPTIDHVVPVSRGGRDEESNWVCASQLRNSAKGNWLLEELGWALQPPGNHSEWDGLWAWFETHVSEHPDVLDDTYIRAWHRAAERAATEEDPAAVDRSSRQQAR